MKILVIGCGSIGRRHIRLLKEMGVEVAGIEPDLASRQRVYAELVVPTWETLQAALDHGPYDGAIIATPNHLHTNPAIECLQRRIPVLVEKPMTHRVDEAHMITAAVERNLETLEEINVPLLVGYCLRFHPGLRRLKQIIDEGTIGTVRHATIHFGSFLPDWRPGTDYRTNYAASREQGGGILMDASHELDYACWLFGEPESVMCQMQNTGALEIETEDVADLVVRFRSGVQANIHLDYLSRNGGRGTTVIGDRSNAAWYFQPPSSQVWTITGNRNPVIEHFSGDPDNLYRAELQHFLAIIRGEETPLVTGEDGLRVLRVVEAAKESAQTGRLVRL